MNKFIKGCLYVAGIMAAVGLVFFILGSVFGGLRQAVEIGRNGGFDYAFYTPQGWNVSFDLDDIRDFTVGDYDPDYDSDFYTDFEEIDDVDLIDYEEGTLGTVDEIDAIEIGLRAGEISVKESDDNTYRLEADDVYKVKCYMHDHVLHIRGDGIRGDFTTSKKQKITLYVPKNAGLYDVDIELGAGIGKIEQLDTEELSVEVGAGKMKGSNVTAQSADIQVGAGSVDLRDCTLGDVEYEVGMGSAYYQGSLQGNADISCNMGNVVVEMDGQETDYDYRIECAMGSVIVGERQFAGISGEKRMDNGAENMMNIDCAMGNVSVQFEK